MSSLREWLGAKAYVPPPLRVIRDWVREETQRIAEEIVQKVSLLPLTKQMEEVEKMIGEAIEELTKDKMTNMYVANALWELDEVREAVLPDRLFRRATSIHDINYAVACVVWDILLRKAVEERLEKALVKA